MDHKMTTIGPQLTAVDHIREDDVNDERTVTKMTDKMNGHTVEISMTKINNWMAKINS